MSKVLLLFAHPALEKSRIHTRLLKQIPKVANITFNDLYEEYPDFDIDVEREKQLLIAHDIIVFQHPFYWYSSPAIIKEWQDLVLQHQWAYGLHGKALAGKKWIHIISSGGSKEAYTEAGLNKYTINQLLAPFERTAKLCNMHFLPPLVFHGTHRLENNDLDNAAYVYHDALIALANDTISETELEKVSYINDLFLHSKPIQ